METVKLQTKCAPAYRTPTGVLHRQCADIAELSDDLQMLNAVPDFLVVLNQEREIVFANNPLVSSLGKAPSDLFGVRLGEALDCQHASEEAGGCGTSESCSTCGALRATLAGLDGRINDEECRITSRSGEALDFRVWATPIILKGKHFVTVAAVDISDEKRRLALERIFFHDLLNTAGGLLGCAEILKDAGPSEQIEVTDMVHQLTEQLIEEINAQRQLSAAENNDLAVNVATLASRTLLEEVIRNYRQHVVASGKAICLDASAEDVPILTDGNLLRRVLGNMVKNALEASSAGATITVGIEREGADLTFWVHNSSCMPRPVQLQVFQRSFSTKGSGRGLGTYSIKLLSEKYLKGRVSFSSSPESGTIFRACFPLRLA